jgi:hypothetical protein
MGLLGTRRRREQEPQLADLDALRALSTASGPLEAAGLTPTGVGSICVKKVDPGTFPGLDAQLEQFETATTFDGEPKFEVTTDEFGHRWLTRHAARYDLNGLINDLYDVNHSLDRGGFGRALLCTIVTFTAYDRPTLCMVFRPRRGTWYPFVPIGENKRDNDRELKVRAMFGDNLKIEPDLAKWSPVWGAPGL